jgi:hypothetical protein
MIKRSLIFVLFATPLVLSCQDAQKKQGRALVERIQAIDIKIPYDKRKVPLSALRELAINDENFQRIRVICVKAHSALIESEQQQAIARQALDRVGSGETGQQVPSEKALAIASALEQSNAQLKRAMAAFPDCEREVRALTLRYER